MRYYKSSQPVPGKGIAYTYYECADDHTVNRYVTFIPATAETKRVADPVVKTLYQPESLMQATEEEFRRHWPDSAGGGKEKAGQQLDASGAPRESRAWNYFDPDMTVGEAMTLHPKVGEVFAAFQLGGCSHCAVSEFETIGQVCAAYGVDVNTLLEVLEELMAEQQQASARQS